MPLTAQYVLAELERNAEALRGFGVKRIGLFGSVARGEAREDSDLDFVIEFARHDPDDYFGARFLLEDTFGCEVNLLEPGGMNPRFEKLILPDVVYAKGL